VDKFSLPEKLNILEQASAMQKILIYVFLKITQPSLTPTYPLNTGHAKQNYNIFSGSMIFCKSVQYYCRCSQSTVIIGNSEHFQKEI
jgi:hypothetical protein